MDLPEDQFPYHRRKHDGISPYGGAQQSLDEGTHYENKGHRVEQSIGTSFSLNQGVHEATQGA
jgi:hypothetical protein